MMLPAHDSFLVERVTPNALLRARQRVGGNAFHLASKAAAQGPPHPRGAAFTLLEVLVALAVFALAAVMLASAYLNVLNAYASANRTALRDDNVRFARAFLLAEPDRRKAEEGDSFEGTGGVRVAWRATIEPTSTADLFHVEFVCEVNEPNSTERRPAVTEQFMLLRPTWSEGIDTAKLRADAKERILELRAKLK